MEPIEVEIPYDLTMCVRGVCEPLIIPISRDFTITSLEIDAKDIPLASACKVHISFGSEVVYNSLLGSQGFTLSVVDIDEGVAFDITLKSDCSLLVDLTDEIEPIRVLLRGVLKPMKSHSKSFRDEWL